MARRFRNSMTSTAGNDPAVFVQGRILNVNLVNWTVDVVCLFDRQRFFEVQVASPYLHFSNGEGIYVVPEVGAVCMVCIPSDTSGPYVAHFLAPHEVLDTATEDAPLGTRSQGAPQKGSSDATFSAGRLPGKPGDIVLRTRDGNFVILHRGGVLSIGATELAQRIYIPLNNSVMDISENYAHHNIGGSVVWGLQEGPAQSNHPTQYVQTVRVFADDKYADIRIAQGRVYSAVPEPDGGASLSSAGISNTDANPIIYEITVSPKGFVGQSGDVKDASTGRNSVYKFVFDRTGNTYTRCEGSFVQVAKKRYVLKVTSDYELTCASGSIVATEGLTLDGGVVTTVKGTMINLGAAQQPVARQGDAVIIPGGPLFATVTLGAAGSVGPAVMGVPLPATVIFTSAPGGTPVPLPLQGTITGGNPAILA